jgi:UDP-2,3-diacylglucosamine hydrolase
MPEGGAERCALFISDLHLSADEPATTAGFLRFLCGPARQAESLTILGDLFDYWAGDDDLDDPFNAQIISALRGLSDSGVPLAFMAGNRDFLIGADFARAAGVTLLPDPYLQKINGIRTVLTHGDALCTDDLDYQAFRRQVRDPDWQAHFLARPLATRRAEISALRQRSEQEKQIKPAAIMDVNPAAVAVLLRQHAAQTLIHGHTHRPGHHHLNVDGQPCQRWVLGDWHPGQSPALCCARSVWHVFA